MTDLRQKMIRAMELKNLSDNTQRAYLAGVTGIASYYLNVKGNLIKSLWTPINSALKGRCACGGLICARLTKK